MKTIEQVLSSKKPALIAHRGSRHQRNLPENTLPAFQEAVDLGADGIELDIRLSKDDELVVFHDSNLKQVTGVRAKVRDLDYSAISELPLAEHSGYSQIRIPRLSDVLDEFKNNIIYNVEVKPQFASYRFLAEKLLKTIKSFDLEKNIWVSSFDSRFLESWYSLKTGVPAAFLFDKWNVMNRYKCYRPYAEWLHPSIDLLSHLHFISRHRKPICFWTVNSLNRLFELKNHRIAAIITDKIPTAKEIFESDV